MIPSRQFELFLAKKKELVLLEPRVSVLRHTRTHRQRHGSQREREIKGLDGDLMMEAYRPVCAVQTSP